MVAVVTATGDAAAFITGVWSMREGVTVAMAICGSSGCSTTFVEIGKVRDAYLLLIRITRSFDSYSLRNHCRCSPDYVPTQPHGVTEGTCRRGKVTENVSVDMDDATVPTGKGNSDTRYAGN